jgi:hypothetical protein
LLLLLLLLLLINIYLKISQSIRFAETNEKHAHILGQWDGPDLMYPVVSKVS